LSIGLLQIWHTGKDDERTGGHDEHYIPPIFKAGEYKNYAVRYLYFHTEENRKLKVYLNKLNIGL
jgi:hypothetical protein